MSLANILKTPTSAPSITSAYAETGGNDYGATIRGDSLTPAVAPLTLISFTVTSTHDFVAGVSNSITVYNNNINLAIGGGCVMEITGPL